MRKGLHLNRELDHLFLSWLDQIGGKLPYPVPLKVKVYLDLIETLLLHGHTKEDVLSTVMKNQVVYHSHNPNAKKAKGWRDVLEKSWNMALVTKWPIETAKFDHEAEDARQAMLAEELAKMELEQKIEQGKKDELLKAQLAERQLEQAKRKEESEEYVRSAPEMDRSDLIKYNPNVTRDAEMSKWLGFDE